MKRLECREVIKPLSRALGLAGFMVLCSCGPGQGTGNPVQEPLPPPPGVTVEVDPARSSRVLGPGRGEVVFVVKQHGRAIDRHRLRLTYTEVNTAGGERLGESNLTENLVSTGVPPEVDPVVKVGVKRSGSGALGIYQKEGYPVEGVIVERGKRYAIVVRGFYRAPGSLAFSGQTESDPYLIQVK